MTKKRTTKKQTFTFKREYILWIIVLILVALQGVSAWRIVKLQEYADSNSNLSMRFLLKNSEEERYKYPIIDVAENRVYIPEARIYLPLNDTSRDMRYDYREFGGDNSFKILYFSVSSVVGQQGNSQFASCDKMVTLADPAKIQGRKNNTVGTIQTTKDGLSDISMYTDEPCWNQEWYANLRHNLVEVVKTAKNY